MFFLLCDFCLIFDLIYIMFPPVLMQSIREDIDKEHLEIQSTDVIMFFKVAEFVTSFQYHKCVASKV